MKNDKQSLRQRLSAAMGRNPWPWLRYFTQPRTADSSPSIKAGNTTKPLQHTPPRDSVRHSFSSELFAELLTELPEYQQKLSQAYQDGDLQSLRNDVHQLLGAIVYCDAPELEGALRALHRALTTTDTDIIDSCYMQAFNTINSTLIYSGISGGR